VQGAWGRGCVQVVGYGVGRVACEWDVCRVRCKGVAFQGAEQRGHVQGAGCRIQDTGWAGCKAERGRV